ncbi:MAG: iron hydrogenase small subunit, partial [Deltaproteobacteria bacterium]
PYHHGNFELLKKRTQALYAEDAGKTIRKSHENPYILELYEKYLGKPLSEKSHHLLHTHYFKRSKI